MLAKCSNCFLLLAVFFTLSLSIKAQIAPPTTLICDKGFELDTVLDFEYESVTVYDYDPVEHRTIPRTELQNVRKLRWKCVPVKAGSSSVTSRNTSSSHPNTVRNANGNLSPANGYRWINSKDPNDFRVELLPGLVSPEPGKLRPADCYQWLNPKDPDDFRVEIKTGLVKTETGCRPDIGYRWVNSKDPKDFSVERIP